MNLEQKARALKALYAHLAYVRRTRGQAHARAAAAKMARVMLAGYDADEVVKHLGIRTAPGAGASLEKRAEQALARLEKAARDAGVRRPALHSDPDAEERAYWLRVAATATDPRTRAQAQAELKKLAK